MTTLLLASSSSILTHAVTQLCAQLNLNLIIKNTAQTIVSSLNGNNISLVITHQKDHFLDPIQQHTKVPCIYLSDQTTLLSNTAGPLHINLKLPIRLYQLVEAIHYARSQPRVAVSKPVMIGPYIMDSNKRQLARADGSVIILTEKEEALLSCLSHAGTSGITPGALLETVWGYGKHIDTDTLTTHIYRLRQKIDPEGSLIVMEHGKYKLSDNADSS